MKVVEYDSSGHKFKIAVPESVEEYDQLAKKQGACLDAAIDHEVYHGTLGDVRDSFAGLVGEHYSIPRRKIGTGVFEGEGDDRKETTVDEKDSVYLKRVAAEKELTGDAPFQSIADRLSHGGDKEVKFDPSVRERKTPTPPKPAKKDIEGATAFLAKASEKAIASFIAHAKKVANFDVVHTGNSETDITAFARAAQAIRAATNVFGKE